jgi:hypothetical protein
MDSYKHCTYAYICIYTYMYLHIALSSVIDGFHMKRFGEVMWCDVYLTKTKYDEFFHLAM